jgi:hypothetical protein
MWQTSAAFNAALQRSRRIATRVEVLSGGQSQQVLDVVVTGSVTAENSAVRRSGSFTLLDPEGTLTPVTAKDMLAPRGTEVRLFKGLKINPYPDDTTEWVPLATLRIAEPTIRRDESGFAIDVKGYDRAKSISQRRFTEPWSIADNTVVTQAISDIITSRSTYPVNITPAANTTNVLVFEQLSDPMAAVQQLADAISYEAFFDVLGTFVARPVPDYNTLTPSWAYAPGEMSLLMHNTRNMTDQDAYSCVVVTSEAPDLPTPIRVKVFDLDPQSPTYYDPAHPELSTYGLVPFGFSSPIITTTDQATKAGTTIGARVFGLQEQVTVDALGHWGHDIGDVVAATDPDTRLAGTHIIEKINQPLRGGPMTLTMRQRRVVNL